MPQPKLKPGEKYGKLQVVERVFPNHKEVHSRWRCRCECGTEIVILASALRRKWYPIGSCGCARITHGPKSPNWGGHGEISGDFWHNIRRGAEGRKKGGGQKQTYRGGVPFEITIEQAWTLFEAQDRRCALTGIPLVMYPKRERTASLDRIDSKVGYTLDNVQWIHKDVNIMKNRFPENRFLAVCVLVVRHGERTGRIEK